MKKKQRDSEKTGGVIPLKDLIPRQDPKGGGAARRKTVFGGGPSPSDRDAAAPALKRRPGKK